MDRGARRESHENTGETTDSFLTRRVRHPVPTRLRYIAASDSEIGAKSLLKGERALFTQSETGKSSSSSAGTEASTACGSGISGSSHAVIWSSERMRGMRSWIARVGLLAEGAWSGG